MTDAKMLKKFASDLCVVLPATVQVLQEACQSLQKTASANKQLEQRAKDAENAKVSFDEAKLYKAAGAVSKLFGNQLSAEQLFDIFKANPNAMADSLYKTASHQVGKTISANIGVVRDMGNSHATKITKEMSAGDIYMQIRNNR